MLPILMTARDQAGQSPYFDDSPMLDAADVARVISMAAQERLNGQGRIAEEQPNLTLTTLGGPLAGMSLPTLRANELVRASLRAAARNANTNAVPGIFGKSLWIFSSTSEWHDQRWRPGCLDPGIGMVSESVPAGDYSNLDRFNLRGWLGSVHLSLRRRAHIGDLRDSVEAATLTARRIAKINWGDDRQVWDALQMLKCFTQPTWWIAKPTGGTGDTRLDRHFTCLFSEQQYRMDLRKRATSEWVLAITDVASLFLGDIRNQEDMSLTWEGERCRRGGIAGRVIAAIRDSETRRDRPTEGLLAARLQAAADLDAALTRVAEAAVRAGGAAYATHGDGASVLLPRDAWPAFVDDLHSTPPTLATALGGVVIAQAPHKSEAAAEMALLIARAALTLCGGRTAAHLGFDPTPSLDLAQARWVSLSESRDAVERWMGNKALAKAAEVLRGDYV